MPITHTPKMKNKNKNYPFAIIALAAAFMILQGTFPNCATALATASTYVMITSFLNYLI